MLEAGAVADRAGRYGEGGFLRVFSMRSLEISEDETKRLHRACELGEGGADLGERNEGEVRVRVRVCGRREALTLRSPPGLASVTSESGAGGERYTGR